MLTTTKRKLHAETVCKGMMERLSLWLPEDFGDDDEIPLLEILDRNGAEDAIWALRACDGAEEIARYFARWCAKYALTRWLAPTDTIMIYLRTGEEASRVQCNALTMAAAKEAGCSSMRFALQSAGYSAIYGSQIRSSVWAAIRAAAWARANDMDDAAEIAALWMMLAKVLRKILIDGVPVGGTL